MSFKQLDNHIISLPGVFAHNVSQPSEVPDTYNLNTARLVATTDKALELARAQLKESFVELLQARSHDACFQFFYEGEQTEEALTARLLTETTHAIDVYYVPEEIFTDKVRMCAGNTNFPRLYVVEGITGKMTNEAIAELPFDTLYADIADNKLFVFNNTVDGVTYNKTCLDELENWKESFVRSTERKPPRNTPNNIPK